MSAQSGLAQIAFCTAGTLATTPTSVVAMGITSNEDLKTTRLRGIKIEHQDHDLPNYDNLLLSASSVQCSIFMFMTLLGFRGGNCDIQIITRDNKVYKFLAASNPLGIKPKLIYNKDSRIITVDVEGAFSQTAWDAILTAAASASAVSLGLTPDSGADHTKQRLVYPLATECPIATELFGNYIERSLTIEPKEKAKTIANISLFDKLTATINIVMEDISQANYITQRGKGTAPSFLFKDGNVGAAYDAFSFAAGVLVQDPVYNITGVKTELAVALKGAFPVSKMTGAYGIANGGSATDGGVTGGTLSVAAS